MLKTSDAKASLPAKTALQRRLKDRSARIAVLGAGYVGLPLALRFAEAGFATLAIDIDAEKVAALNAGRSYIRTISDEAVARAHENGLTASGDIARVGEADALVLCVPTPLNPYREPDLQYVTGTLEAIGPHLRAGHVLSLESTTWPGTTSQVLAPRLKEHGFRIGEDVFLVYSPEREDPGNARFTTKTIPKLVGGETPACLEAGIALYRGIVDQVVPVSSPQVAEITKLLENIHRAVNIGLVNEMKVVADRMGIDIREVIDAAATKPFGFTPYYPGPGIGGHCIPVDPFYLTWKAREYGLHTRFIELAGEINAGMPAWVAAKAGDALNARGKPLKGARVLMLGIAYKKNIGDCRESPAVRIMEILREKGAELSYADPFVPVFPKMREHHFELTAVEPTAETLASADVAVLATDHDAFDYALIREHCPLVVDTRGVYREGGENIVKA